MRSIIVNFSCFCRFLNILLFVSLRCFAFTFLRCRKMHAYPLHPFVAFLRLWAFMTGARGLLFNFCTLSFWPVFVHILSFSFLFNFQMFLNFLHCDSVTYSASLSFVSEHQLVRMRTVCGAHDRWWFLTDFSDISQFATESRVLFTFLKLMQMRWHLSLLFVTVVGGWRIGERSN